MAAHGKGPPTLRPPRRHPGTTDRGWRWTDGAGRALHVVLLAVAMATVVGASTAYVFRQASTPPTAQPEPNVSLPEIDLSFPTPAPDPTSIDGPPTAAPALPGQTPTPRRSTMSPRPRPTTAKPRPPVHLLSEAESPQHQVTGNTRPRSNHAASGDTVIGWVGNGADNTLRLSVTVPDADWYAVTLFYISAYSRQAVVRVNGGVGRTVAFPPTDDWSTVRSLALRLALRSGQNTIELGNPYYHAPDFDRIMVTR